MAELMSPVPIDAASAFAGGPALGSAETAQALRWLKLGAFDESTLRLELPPAIRATVSPIVTALRWGAVLFGMVFAGTDANSGDLAVVVTVAIVLFLTIWRTFRPLRLAWDGLVDRALPVTDGLIIGGAVGLSSGFDSPFIFCLVAAVVVAAFGWGLRMGVIVLGAALAAMWVASSVTNAGFNLDNRNAWALLLSMVVIVGLIVFVRQRLLEAEQRRATLTYRVDMLTETNDLLSILNQVAKTLPASLDMSEALNATRDQLAHAFGASTIGLLTRDEATSSWLPQISEGCDLPNAAGSSDLPAPLKQALLEEGTVLRASLDPASSLSGSTGSGLYTALRTRGKIIGVLGVENPSADAFSGRDSRILEGLADALALTIDNAKWFGRLRVLGADEERTRIARDLHDRLGQWLTYISIELERIMSEGSGRSPALEGLYGDVQSAIDELRETLRQLRTGVSEKSGLGEVGAEVARRYTERTGTAVNFNEVYPGQRVATPVENEMLRIMQEALNNAEKHAEASRVDVTWEARNGEATLVVADNGKGFDIGTGIRDTAYGLVGMRERADVIGASLHIDTAPGQGTTVSVTARNEDGI